LSNTRCSSRWITPSVFAPLDASIVDEYTLCAEAPNAEAILKNHWDTWVTFADFQKIAGAGFNTVRIPIGYWAYQKYPGDTYIQGAAPYLDKAIAWARQTGLKVWIDLHGAPLSQNGFDNSGQFKSAPGWTTGNSVAFTVGVLDQISQKYAQPAYQDVVIAIELLNEPKIDTLPGGQSAVRQFYRDGFAKVRAVSNTPVILQDGFETASAWNGFLTPSDNNAQNVVIDHHEYQMFDNYLVSLPPWVRSPNSPLQIPETDPYYRPTANRSATTQLPGPETETTGSS
jgi:glucan 1,3-beta-glucosidase